jgi:hypothetical protein
MVVRHPYVWRHKLAVDLYIQCLAENKDNQHFGDFEDISYFVENRKAFVDKDLYPLGERLD